MIARLVSVSLVNRERRIKSPLPLPLLTSGCMMPPQASVLSQDLPAMHVPGPFTTALLQGLKTHRPLLEHQAAGVNSPHTAVFPTLDAMRVRKHDSEKHRGLA